MILDPQAPAILSPCEQYRYWLTRSLGLFGWRPVVFVMLNPSTADHRIDDPTIRQCKWFAEAWGGSLLIVVNLYAWRATDPGELLWCKDPIGSENEAALELAIDQVRDNGIAVAAWGAHRMVDQDSRGEVVRLKFEASGVPLHCLGRTLEGKPKHPLYIPHTQRPERWAS